MQAVPNTIGPFLEQLKKFKLLKKIFLPSKLSEYENSQILMDAYLWVKIKIYGEILHLFMDICKRIEHLVKKCFSLQWVKQDTKASWRAIINWLLDKMKSMQVPLNTRDIKPTNLVLNDGQSDRPNNATETPVADSASVSVSSNDKRKVSREDIELVQNLIERCLQLYMNRDEVVKTLLNRARIDTGFTSLVWQKLEEENAEFFRAYYIRLKLKKQIISFNHLLEHQYHLMRYQVHHKVPLAPAQNGTHPMQNGIHPMPANNLPMGYPVMQQHSVPATGQPHIDPMGFPTPNCHVVNGIPAPGNYLPMRMNCGNDMVIDNITADVTPVMPPNNGLSSMSDFPASPTSVASSSHFPFTASEISGMAVDTSALDTAFTTDVAGSVGLQLSHDNGAGNSRDSLRSLAQIPWNFSLSDLTADLSNMGDLGALGNYPGSPFLPSDSDILLDSPEQEDIVEEFFVDSDSIPGQCQPSDEDNS